MSITKTTFRNDSRGLQATEVLEWLQATGTKYFDSITYDTDNMKIICTIDDITALEIYFDSSVYKGFTASLINGASISGKIGAIGLFVYGITTNNGLCLNYINGTVSPTSKGYTNNYLIITKDNNNDTTFIFLGYDDTASSVSAAYGLQSGTFSKYTWNNWTGLGTTSIYEDKGICYSAAMTSLIPFTDKNYPIYTPKAFLLQFNQYIGTSGQFTIDGVNYFTTGFMALSD